MAKTGKAALKAQVKKDLTGEHQRAIEILRQMKEQVDEVKKLVECLGDCASTETGREKAEEASDTLHYGVRGELDCAIGSLEQMVGDNVCLSVLQERLGLEVETPAF